ncbi:MAG: isochorismate synthase, partial [Aequorivita sp.]|nr:isochorismate synthase [Aequorivita sp.]
MDFNLLTKKIEKHFEEGLPFVVYSLPNQKMVSALLQKSPELSTISELTANGFVLAPFEYNDSAYFIPENESEIVSAELSENTIELTPVPVAKNASERKTYLEKVQKTIDNIKRRRATKIVISRPKDFPLSNFSLKQLLERLFGVYPSAFRYIWYHPQTGMWCGATPETLVRVETDSFKTMALAGTQPFYNSEKVSWGPKELDEQQMVTDSITNSLQRVTSVLKVSNPYT